MEKNFRGYSISVVLDESPSSPREWDNLGTLIGWHNRYNIGDKNPFGNPQEAQEYFEENKSIVLPVYMYDHSGVTLSTKPFSCPWDSGQVGFIYCDLSKALKEFNAAEVSDDLIEKVKKSLQCELEVYDKYQRGEVFGYIVKDSSGEDIDSCWGFYCEKEAELRAIDSIEADIEQKIKEKVKKVKAYIKNRVPLESRSLQGAM